MTEDEFNTDEDFNAAYTRYHQTVLSKIHNVVQNLDVARDLTEEVFIIASRRHANFDPDKSTLKMSLYGITTSVLRSFERGGKPSE